MLNIMGHWGNRNSNHEHITSHLPNQKSCKGLIAVDGGENEECWEYPGMLIKNTLIQHLENVA